MNVLNENIVSLLKGEKGDGLEIKKWYASVEAMNADYSNSDIAVGDSVAINETLDLYVKGASAFEHKGSLKGEQGKDGTGLNIKKWYTDTDTMNADYSNPDIAVGDSVAIDNTLDLYVKGASAFEYKGTLKGAKGDVGADALVYSQLLDEYSVYLSISNFNREPNVGEIFNAILTGGGESYLLICKVKNKNETAKAVSFDVENGVRIDGKDGTTFTPSVDASGNLSWTNDGDKENPTTVNIKGANGDKGNDGTTFTPSVDASGNLSWTNDGGKENPQTVNIKGANGDKGNDGTTFTPSVDASGNLSWTNDGGKENPQTVNIKGPKGDSGLTDEQIQMFTYLAQHMTVDQENGKITFSCEVAGAAFDAITEE